MKYQKHEEETKMVVTKMGRIVSTICNNTIQERRSCPKLKEGKKIEENETY